MMEAMEGDVDSIQGIPKAEMPKKRRKKKKPVKRKRRIKH